MKRGSRKAQLIELAAKIFAEEGYTETTVERISGEAGISGPAFYRHFSSKQEILDCISLSGMELAVETARELLNEEGLSEEAIVRNLIRSRLDYMFGPMSAPYLLAISQQAHL